jgi:hypothetical protein
MAPPPLPRAPPSEASAPLRRRPPRPSTHAGGACAVAGKHASSAMRGHSQTAPVSPSPLQRRPSYRQTDGARRSGVRYTRQVPGDGVAWGWGGVGWGGVGQRKRVQRQATLRVRKEWKDGGWGMAEAMSSVAYGIVPGPPRLCQRAPRSRQRVPRYGHTSAARAARPPTRRLRRPRAPPTPFRPLPMSTTHSLPLAGQGRSTTKGSRQPVSCRSGGGRSRNGVGSLAHAMRSWSSGGGGDGVGRVQA